MEAQHTSTSSLPLRGTTVIVPNNKCRPFSALPNVAVALVVGASSEQQILADYTSMQTRIPAEF
jgi:hypothetical protein